MILAELVARLNGVSLTGDGTCEIRGVTLDSRTAGPGVLFAALPGLKAHGTDFVRDAVAAGAPAVLSDRPRPRSATMPWIRSKTPRKTTAIAAWELAGNPQRELRMIAVTGTNGKSTTANLIAGLFAASGAPAACIGTLGAWLPDGTVIPGERTTPEATDLAPILRRAVSSGAAAAVVEVSSHAIVQERIAGVEFEVGVWTNLSRDHLDFHHDMDSYFEAKSRLFRDHVRGRRVLPVDDPWGARLLDVVRDGDVSWGLDRGAVCARDVVSDLEGSRFVLRMPDIEVPVAISLVGVHNLRNALAAAAAAHSAGIGAEAIRCGLENARPLTGRLERIETALDAPVFVDYAHTPDGLRSVLQALRKISDLKLIVVFGAGGDRDQGKRGPMGFAVGELADLAIVTSDNPRSEDPETIAGAVAEGVRAAGAEPMVIIDRRAAIATALDQADSRSLVLVAGKGHEAFQTIGSTKLPFSDQAVVREEAGRQRCG